MIRSHGFSIGLALAVGLLSAALAGCNDPDKVRAAPWPASPLADRVTLHQLAGRLDMQIVRCTPYHASLHSRANSVIIFADPEGAVYVNGQHLPAPGPFTASEGTIFVPVNVVSMIRSSLQREPGPQGPQRPPMPPLPRSPLEGPDIPPARAGGIVVLDPGHGCPDTGAIACTGALEKDIVLRTALEVRRRLIEAGVEVIMTRDDDRFIELNRRAEISNTAKADLFVSIHADSAPNAMATGYTVYVSRSASGPAVTAASRVERRLANGAMPSRGIRRADFRVLAQNQRPAMLVELGYLSNRGEARLLGTDSCCRQMAQAIAAGILDYLQK